MVNNNATSLKIDFVSQLYGILNPKEFLNCIIGLKVSAIFQDGCVLPIGGVSLVEGLINKGLPRLVYT